MRVNTVVSSSPPGFWWFRPGSFLAAASAPQSVGRTVSQADLHTGPALDLRQGRSRAIFCFTAFSAPSCGFYSANRLSHLAANHASCLSDFRPLRHKAWAFRLRCRLSTIRVVAIDRGIPNEPVEIPPSLLSNRIPTWPFSPTRWSFVATSPGTGSEDWPKAASP